MLRRGASPIRWRWRRPLGSRGGPPARPRRWRGGSSRFREVQNGWDPPRRQATGSHSKRNVTPSPEPYGNHARPTRLDAWLAAAVRRPPHQFGTCSITPGRLRSSRGEDGATVGAGGLRLSDALSAVRSSRHRMPIVLAPFGPLRPGRLAAAVCEAGALGSVGTAVRPASELRQQWHRLHETTSRPFAINHTVGPSTRVVRRDPRVSARPQSLSTWGCPSNWCRRRTTACSQSRARESSTT